ncbi:hypothetical protein BQ8794_140198 [Mesorhizobium prunaredense]|uniref:Rhodanese domain-containing protein n=1 Tax=Mesorhizobium prunaredense TaxID=1631249 RepID=A0A1R3V2A8_9HYPH|nr:hypothetical protein BQ8794_140198 [Mesorhizobium prunaredense]
MGRHPLAFRFLGVAGARRSARDQCSPQRTANLSRAVREIHIHSLRWDEGRGVMSARGTTSTAAAGDAAFRNASNELAPRDPVIEPDELSLLAAFRLLDVRDAEAFQADHAASAVRVPVELWEAAAKTGETSFENTSYWERAIADLGVTESVPAVAYDDGRMTEAARVWFILQYFGVEALIVNGGWPAIRERGELLAKASEAPGLTAFRARPGVGSVGLVERDTLKGELDSAQLLDARTAAEFAGTDLRRNARGGHLPGAHLLPHASLLGDGRLKPTAELRGLLCPMPDFARAITWSRTATVVVALRWPRSPLFARAMTTSAPTTSASPTGRRTKAVRSCRTSRPSDGHDKRHYRRLLWQPCAAVEDARFRRAFRQRDCRLSWPCSGHVRPR